MPLSDVRIRNTKPKEKQYKPSQAQRREGCRAVVQRTKAD